MESTALGGHATLGVTRVSSDGFLTRDGGTRINTKRLAAVVAGILSTQVFTGFARIIGSVFDVFIISPLTGVAEFLGTIFEAVFGYPAMVIAASWWPLRAFITELGPFAFPFSVAVVLGIAYVVVKARGLADG